MISEFFYNLAEEAMLKKENVNYIFGFFKISLGFLSITVLLHKTQVD